MVKFLKTLMAINSAYRHIYKNEWASAKDDLRRAAAVYGHELPSLNADFRFNLVFFQISYFSKSLDESIISASVCSDQCLDIKYNEENRYLRQYCRRLIEHCAGRFTDSKEIFLSLAEEIDFEDVAALKVSAVVRKKFPL